MDRLHKMLNIPLDFPPEVRAEAERSAVGNRKFIGYLQALDEDIVLRVFACRRHKGKDLEITEVMRRITQDKHFVYKNLYGGGMAGYQAVYKPMDKSHCSHGYYYNVFDEDDFDVWHISEEKPFGIWYSLLNADMLKDTRFKYCAYNTSVCDDVIAYLNEYIKHPCVEYFGKLGIKPSSTLVRKAEKDKAFRNWLYKTKITVHCGPQAIIYAYEHNISVEEAKRIIRDNAYYQRVISQSIDELKGVKIDRKRVFQYIRENDIAFRSYNDYIKALKKLNYDLTDTKNIFPHDFKRMHDMRIAEYDSVIAKEDAEKNKELYHNFEARAQEAKRFEYQGENYVAIIPAHIQELVKEGRELSHCVGRMGYDKKMADGKVIIVFIRSLLDIAKPLVTVEYSLERKMILQSHGDYNRAPTDEENAFITEWEKRTTKALKVKKTA